MTLLHLSHTDIANDSRILKEMHAIRKTNKFSKIIGFGLPVEYNGGDFKDTDGLIISKINLFTKKWIIFPKRIRHFFSFIELCFKIITKGIKEKPEIIHCNDTYVLPIGVIIKIICKSKLIYDAHELESNRNGVGKFFGLLIFLTEKILWNFIDGLIVVSPSIKVWYEDKIGKKDSEIILNSPVFKETDVKNSNLRDKFGICENSKIFIYIGILMPGRGIDLLVECFEDSKVSSSLVFLGYGEFKDKLLEISKKNNNIFVHDAVAHEDVVYVAQGADVGLCLIENISLSDYYCLPNKLFEYSFAKIPILASNFPDITNIVKAYNLGICTNVNKNDIIDAILELEKTNQVFNDKDLYELSWEYQENKLISFYKKILNKGNN